MTAKKLHIFSEDVLSLTGKTVYSLDKIKPDCPNDLHTAAFPPFAQDQQLSSNPEIFIWIPFKKNIRIFSDCRQYRSQLFLTLSCTLLIPGYSYST